jgi:hypothetical protein
MIQKGISIDEICIFGSNKIENLQKLLAKNKRFMQMVIHDMRNPTVSMEQTLVIAVSQLQEIEDLIEQQSTFSDE